MCYHAQSGDRYFLTNAPPRGTVYTHMPVWWNGRHRGLKIPWERSRAGSSPATGTMIYTAESINFWRYFFLSCNFFRVMAISHYTLIKLNSHKIVTADDLTKEALQVYWRFFLSICRQHVHKCWRWCWDCYALPILTPQGSKRHFAPSKKYLYAGVHGA